MLSIPERIANLKTQRESALASLHALNGAISVLEELQAEIDAASAPAPHAEKPYDLGYANGVAAMIGSADTSGGG